MVGRPLGLNGGFIRSEQSLLGKQRRERNRAQAGAAEAQKIAAIQQPPSCVGEGWIPELHKEQSPFQLVR